LSSTTTSRAVTRLGRHDAENVETFVGAIETVVLRRYDREIAARELGRSDNPRLEVLALPQAKPPETSSA